MFTELAARLYRFTRNETYADWAQKSVEWSRSVGLISPELQIFDGADDIANCSKGFINHIQWYVPKEHVLFTKLSIG
jgi:mannan endo-1,6-alpha-mannosidase